MNETGKDEGSTFYKIVFYDVNLEERFNLGAALEKSNIWEKNQVVIVGEPDIPLPLEQQWALKDAGDGSFHIVNRHNGYYLDGQGDSSRNLFTKPPDENRQGYQSWKSYKALCDTNFLVRKEREGEGYKVVLEASYSSNRTVKGCHLSASSHQFWELVEVKPKQPGVHLPLSFSKAQEAMQNKSDTAISAVNIGKYIYMIWKGPNDDPAIYVASLDTELDKWEYYGETGLKTDLAPVAFAVDNDIMICFRKVNGGQKWMSAMYKPGTKKPGLSGGPINPKWPKASHSPRVCSDGTNAVLAWTTENDKKSGRFNYEYITAIYNILDKKWTDAFVLDDDLVNTYSPAPVINGLENLGYFTEGVKGALPIVMLQTKMYEFTNKGPGNLEQRMVGDANSKLPITAHILSDKQNLLLFYDTEFSSQLHYIVGTLDENFEQITWSKIIPLDLGGLDNEKIPPTPVLVGEKLYLLWFDKSNQVHYTSAPLR